MKRMWRIIILLWTTAITTNAAAAAFVLDRRSSSISMRISMLETRNQKILCRQAGYPQRRKRFLQTTRAATLSNKDQQQVDRHDNKDDETAILGKNDDDDKDLDGSTMNGSLLWKVLCETYHIDPLSSSSSRERIPLLRLDSCPQGIRGLYLNRSVRANEVLLSVPLRVCLRDDDDDHAPPSSGWVAQQEDEKNHGDDASMVGAGNYATQSAWAVRLAAALLARKEQQHQSNVLLDDDDDTKDALVVGDPWLASLPTRDDFGACLPHHWHESQVQRTGCTALELVVEGAYFARAAARQDLAPAAAHDLHTDDDYDDDAAKRRSKQQQQEQQDLYDWALDVVQTRSCRVAIDKENDNESPTLVRVLAPGFDLLNHASPSNAQFQLERVVSTLSSSQQGGEEEDHIVVRALHDLQEHEQVCISYGSSAWPAWKCLASYGFVPLFGGVPATSNDYDEYGNDQEHQAEFYYPVDKRRYLVTPRSIPDDLVEAAMEEEDNAFGPKTARKLAKHMVDVAAQVSTDLEEEDNLPAKLSMALRKNQQQILQACANGLQKWAEEEEQELLS